MRFSTTYILFVSLFMLVWACQSGPRKNQVEIKQHFTGKGKVEFLNEIHNFGAVREGEVLSYSFRMKNSGDGIVRISKITPSCDCVKVKYDTVQMNPGDSGIVEVILDTDGEWGNIVKDLMVTSSGGDSLRLIVGAYVESEKSLILNK